MSHSPAAGRQANVFGSTTSGGQVVLAPLQTSSGSQTAAEARQTGPGDLKVQLALQHEPAVPLAPPWSHCSAVTPFPGASTVPLPQNEVKVTCTKWPSLEAVRDGFPG